MNSLFTGRTAHVLTPLLISALTLGQFACAGGAPSSGSGSDTQVAAAVHYDGETLFRGFFLGSGPVSDQLPELKNRDLTDAAGRLTKEQLAQALEGAATRMKTQGATAGAAGHISTMAADVRSGSLSPGDLLNARRDLAESSGDAIVARIKTADPTFLDRFAADFQSGDHIRVQNAIEEGGRRFLDAASVEGALPGHVTPEARCITVFVVVALVFFWLAYAPPGQVDSDLQRTELVDTIATRFAH